jgi:hypothetical protein
MKSQGCTLHKAMLAMFGMLASSIGYPQYKVKAAMPFSSAHETQKVSDKPIFRLPPMPIPCQEPTKKKEGDCPVHPQM